MWLCAAAMTFHAGCAHRSRLEHVVAPVHIDPNTKESGARRARDWWHQQRAFPNDQVPVDARSRAIEQLEAMKAAVSTAFPAGPSGPNPLNWVPIGPKPIASGGYVVSGLILSLAVDPRDSAVVYGAAHSGGVWKTIDSGRNWAPQGDFWPSVHVGVVRLDPQNPDIVYAATGLDFCREGAGLMKSTDAGRTWTNLRGTLLGGNTGNELAGSAIGALAVHPRDSGVLIAGVDGCGVIPSGYYRSSDGGASWRFVLGGGFGGSVVFNPVNPLTVYAAVGYDAGVGVYRSDDGGLTWSSANGVGSSAIALSNAGLVILAMATSSPSILYASIANKTDGTLLAMYKSIDGGTSWSKLNAPNFCGTQCWAFPALAVHPANPDLIFASGLNFYRSLDGGKTWAQADIGGQVQVHVDHHAIEFSRDASSLYISCDGGVWSASALSSASLQWTALSTGLAVTEFYHGFSVHPTDSKFAIGGTQDNSTVVYNGDLSWSFAGVCGDGGETALDPSTVPATVYAACVGSPWITRSDSGGKPGTFRQPLITGINRSDRTAWLPPLTMDLTNPRRLYFGTYRVYQTNDKAETWAPISGDLTAGQQWNNLTAIGVSSNPDIVYAGSDTGKVSVTMNANSFANATWADRSAGLPNRYISSITTDPNLPLSAYVTVSGFGAGHIFRTLDAGQTWTDISGDLPDIPVNDLLVDPDISGTLYAGTDIGVFRSSNGSRSWWPLGDGLPYTIVTGVKIQKSTRTLRAATHGRGMWDLSVPVTAPRLVSFTVDTGTAQTGMTLTLSGLNFSSESVVLWNGAARPVRFVDSTRLALTLPPADFSGVKGLLAVMNQGPAGGVSDPLALVFGPTISKGGIGSAVPGVAPGVLAPGGIATIFGEMLATKTESAASGAANEVAGTRIEIDGLAAPLFFVSPSQINFQVPWELAGKPSAKLSVAAGKATSDSQTVRIAAVAPAIFTLGETQGAIICTSDGAIAAPRGAFPNSRPAKRGEYITVFMTGLGPVTNPPATGVPSFANPLSRLVEPSYGLGVECPNYASNPVFCTMPTSFAGLAPGFVGLYQVNALVPLYAPVGDRVHLRFGMTDKATATFQSSNIATMAIE